MVSPQLKVVSSPTALWDLRPVMRNLSFTLMTGQTPSDQSRDFLQGQLLIAMPNLRDGCFDHSVVLICSHDDSHAMGLIVNKEISDFSFPELLQQLKIEPYKVAEKRKINFGGPVETKRGIVIHSRDYMSEDTTTVCDGIALTATRKILSDLNGGPGGSGQETSGPAKAILCMGHAGWGPGQLESELIQNAWLNLPATPELIFTAKPRQIWKRALAALGIGPSMFSAAWSDIRDPDMPLN